jgi:hypothetical protein
MTARPFASNVPHDRGTDAVAVELPISFVCSRLGTPIPSRTTHPRSDKTVSHQEKDDEIVDPLGAPKAPLPGSVRPHRLPTPHERWLGRKADPSGGRDARPNDSAIPGHAGPLPSRAPESYRIVALDRLCDDFVGVRGRRDGRISCCTLTTYVDITRGADLRPEPERGRAKRRVRATARADRRPPFIGPARGYPSLRNLPTYAAFATTLPCIAASRSSRLTFAGTSSVELSAYSSNT